MPFIAETFNLNCGPHHNALHIKFCLGIADVQNYRRPDGSLHLTHAQRQCSYEMESIIERRKSAHQTIDDIATLFLTQCWVGRFKKASLKWNCSDHLQVDVGDYQAANPGRLAAMMQFRWANKHEAPQPMQTTSASDIFLVCCLGFEAPITTVSFISAAPADTPEQTMEIVRLKKENEQLTRFVEETARLKKENERVWQAFIAVKHPEIAQRMNAEETANREIICQDAKVEFTQLVEHGERLERVQTEYAARLRELMAPTPSAPTAD